MGILAIPQRHPSFEVDRQPLGQTVLHRGPPFPDPPPHPAGDRRVVLRGAGEGIRGKPRPFRERGAVPADRPGEGGILAGARVDRRECMVFGGRPHKARAADVDQFHAVRRRAARLGCGPLERIEVDDDRIEGLDSVLREHCCVVVAVGPGKQTGKDPRVEGLHAAVENLREAGDRRDVLDLHAKPLERRLRAAGACHPHAAGEQGLGNFLESGLVKHAHQDAANRSPVSLGSGSGGRRSQWGVAHGGD